MAVGGRGTYGGLREQRPASQEDRSGEGEGQLSCVGEDLVKDAIGCVAMGHQHATGWRRKGPLNALCPS